MVEVAILQKASFVLLLLGTTMFVVTFAVPYWFSGSVPGGTIHLGLWKICGRPSASGIETCINTDASNSRWKMTYLGRFLVTYVYNLGLLESV